MIETVLEAFFQAVLNKMSLAVSMTAIFICLLVIYGLIVIVVNERIYYRKTEKSMQEVDRFKHMLAVLVRNLHLPMVVGKINGHISCMFQMEQIRRFIWTEIQRQL